LSSDGDSTTTRSEGETMRTSTQKTADRVATEHLNLWMGEGRWTAADKRIVEANILKAMAERPIFDHGDFEKWLRSN
jgi:hypothetical protein